MGKNTNLVAIANEILSRKCRYGESRHQAKIDGMAKNYIYSLSTFKTYNQQARQFFETVQREHPEVHTLNGAKKYIQEYVNRFNSAWTQATIKSALTKIYGQLDVTVKTRMREDIVRSRFERERDKRFSDEKNKDLIAFLKATGLRRREAESITGDSLKYISGKPFLCVIGKGGKYREIPISEQFVENKLRSTPKEEKVFGEISSAIDIHSYRAEYATNLYNSLKRKNIPKEDRYICRKDKAGLILDKVAMLEVSRRLGHGNNRIDVFANSYLID